MFDIGWSEMAVIALIALIVIGPKDLPKTMKTIAHWMRKARSLTREFQSGIDEMVREAELEDAKKALESTRSGNLQRTLSNAIDPDDEVGGEVRSIEREARSESGGSSPQAGKGGDSEAEGNAERAAASLSSASAAPQPTSSGSAEQSAKSSGDATPASGDKGSKKTA
jgi:sec-independent protein translocase protein TatB